jgi:hypothetical protein
MVVCRGRIGGRHHRRICPAIRIRGIQGKTRQTQEAKRMRIPEHVNNSHPRNGYSHRAGTHHSRRWNTHELRLLADRILIYGKTVYQHFPTGDVVVSERDLAEQLRKRPEAVVTALNLLLNEQKVQRAPLNGYWKLNS